MTTALYLERFDDTAQTEAAPLGRQTPPAGYEDGYADGLAAAEATFASDQLALKAELVQSIETAAFGYHEAQGTMIAAVKPLLEEMLHTLLPSVLAPALCAHLRDILEAALRADLTVPMRLAIPPNQFDAVQAALADVNAPQLELHADPDLGAHAAWANIGGQETSLDLDAALTAIGDHIATLHTLIDQSQEVS
jgi:hypothetical protein